MQSRGVLNAFATRFIGKHYIVLYSDILEVAYEEGEEAVKFIIGHELGHVKRGHLNPFLKFLMFPSYIFPFLSKAYYRACEYTCDNIGYSLAPKGAIMGLLILAAGKNLYKQINLEEYLENTKADTGILSWLAEIFSTHPHLNKRIRALYNN